MTCCHFALFKSNCCCSCSCSGLLLYGCVGVCARGQLASSGSGRKCESLAAAGPKSRDECHWPANRNFKLKSDHRLSSTICLLLLPLKIPERDASEYCLCSLCAVVTEPFEANNNGIVVDVVLYVACMHVAAHCAVVVYVPQYVPFAGFRV